MQKVQNPGSHRTYHWLPQNQFQNGRELLSGRKWFTSQCFYSPNSLESEENDRSPKEKLQKLFFEIWFRWKISLKILNVIRFEY